MASLAGFYGTQRDERISPYWVDASNDAGDIRAALDTKIQSYVDTLGGNKFIRKVAPPPLPKVHAVGKGALTRAQLLGCALFCESN